MGKKGRAPAVLSIARVQRGPFEAARCASRSVWQAPFPIFFSTMLFPEGFF